MADRDYRRPGASGPGSSSHESAPAGDAQKNALIQRRWIQRKAAKRDARPAAIPTGGGKPLEESAASRLAPHVGGDLSEVRVHTGSDSSQAAGDLGARAFTVGNDVHFGAGEFAPGTREGDRLLAHELTHAVDGGGAKINRKADAAGADAAKEAKSEGAEAAQGEAAEGGEQEVSQPENPAEQKADAKGDAAAAEHDKPPTPEEEEFNQLTNNACASESGGVDVQKITAWQEQHQVPASGKLDEQTLEAARAEKSGKKEGEDGKEEDLSDEEQELAPDAKEKAEGSTGADMSGVKVHKGPKSAAAAKEKGAEAYTEGQDIVLGEGQENNLNPVMAHEMAHTAQQKGGEKGVAQKSKRGSSGSAFEKDADRAGAAIMAGAKTQVAEHGAEHVACFEGGEHMQLGTEGFAKAGVDGPLSVGKVKAEAGLFTALQGDFYGGNWEDLEKDCTDKPDGVYKLLGVLKNEQGERKAHDADPEHHKSPDSDGAIIIATMGMRAKYLDYASDNAAHFSEQSEDSEKKMEGLAAANPEYAGEIGGAEGKFGANVAEYLRLHIDAIQRGFGDAIGGKPIDPCLAMDAGANHFLTDAFASGHQRTPRDAMMKEYHAVFQAKGRQKVDSLIDEHLPDQVDVPAALGLGGLEAMLPSGDKPPPIHLAGIKAQIKHALYPVIDGITSKVADQASNFGAKTLHDADNKGGLNVHNGKGDAWRSTGDNEMSKGEQNIKQAEMAVAASAGHTKTLYEAGAGQKGADKDKSKEKPKMPYHSMQPILDLLPMVDADNAPEQDWHWETASDEFKQSIIVNMKGAIAGTIESATDAIKHQAQTSIQAGLQAMLGGLGHAGQWIAQHISALVEWLVNKLPSLPPEAMLYSIML